MFLIKPYIFSSFAHITAGMSTKAGVKSGDLYFFNMSLNINDEKDKVLENRKAFFNHLKFADDEIVFQNQIHSDIITAVNSAGNCGESDALITAQKNLLLVLTVADCTPIIIYDAKNQVIAAVHSGWRGAENRILRKTLSRMYTEFNSKGENIYAYLGPSISQINYEVGKEVADLFDKKYVLHSKSRFLLDVASVNYDMLIDFGVKPNNIQKSVLCTYQMKDLLHSYRRDGNKSGRSFSVIGMRN